MMKNSFIERDDLSLLVSYQKGQSRNELLSIIDNLKQDKDNYIIALLGDENGSVPIVVACSQKANEKGYKAGALVKAMAQVLLGGGGGRDELASGSGRDASKVEAAIQLVKEMVK